MESQTVEWKKEWKEEALKEVCAFANSSGGTLIIGIDDDGRIVGIGDPKDTMKKIADTIHNKLSLSPVISFDEATSTISVKIDRQTTPTMYHGKYYLRSGSVTHEAAGRDHDRLAMKTLNISWMDMKIEGLDIGCLDGSAIDYLRTRMIESGKISPANIPDSNEELLTSLRLSKDGCITRNAVLLFHPDPESIMIGTATRVGYFDGAKILFQDIVSGPLITRFNRLYDLITTKYIIRPMAFHGQQLVENAQYPPECLREGLLNALIYHDYASRTDVLIRVENEQLSITDKGGLSDDLSLDTILSERISDPPNQTLARVFFLSGFVETQGRGLQTMIDSYESSGLDSPTFSANTRFFKVTMKPLIDIDRREPQPEDMQPVEDAAESALLTYLNCSEGRSLVDIADRMQIGDKKKFHRSVIRPLMSRGLVEFTIPQHPNSKNQRYRATELGRKTIHQRSVE